ncbi:MAG: M28 family peptidase, partial [Hyphomicrobiales bacterium]
MRGREAGSPDFDVAAEYMAAQMLAQGLKPGVDGGWFQPVTLTSYKPVDKTNWTLTRGAAKVPLQFGIDFIPTTGPILPTFSAEGGLVFAGYGVVYAQGGIDDYKGLDVRGKIVAIFPGVPKGLPGEVEAHFGDDDQKARLAQSRGAKAVIVLESPSRRAQFPFEAVVPYWDYERSGWAGPDGKPNSPAPGAPVIGYVGPIGAEKLFTGARIKWADVIAAEKKGGKLPTGVLTGTLSASTKVRTRTVATRNVVGLLEGADPVLKDQVIVLSAHLDHVGIGEAVNGDRIYNGAMDNAVGNAVML